MHYLLTASLLLLVIAPAYYFLLRYSERYALNRWLLLLGLTLVCLLPAVELPSPAPAATHELQGSIRSLVRSVNGEATPVSLTTETRPVTDAEGNTTWMLHDRSFGFGKVQMGYLLGLVVMLLLLGVRLLALLRAYALSWPGDFPADFRILTTAGDPGQAFTFFRQIYLGRDVVDDPDLPLILAHERVHARQLHTLDVLFSEFFLCLFWFHPVAWWLRTRLRANLEYLVDATVVRRTAKRDYQLALVRQSTRAYGLAFALPFSEPTLRGRIQRLANLPRHWGVAATAALALLLWLGTALLVMRGTTEERRSAVPNVHSIYDQARQSGDPVELALATHHSRIRQVVTEPIQSFALYFRRLPTPDETAQIMAVLSLVPHTNFSVYADKEAGPAAFHLQLDHWLNRPGKTFLSLQTGELLTNHRVLKLVRREEAAPHVTAGYFTPAFAHTMQEDFFEDGMASGPTQQIIHHADGSTSERTIAHPRGPLADYDENLVNLEVAMVVNGSWLPFWEPVLAEKNYAALPSPPPPPNVRLQRLLDCAQNGYQIRKHVRQNIPGRQRNWFEQLPLPLADRTVVYFHNDRVSSEDVILDRELSGDHLLQVGYVENDPDGAIIVQLIDDRIWF